MRRVKFTLSRHQVTTDTDTLDAEDMAILLGVRCGRSLRAEVARGSVPKPDKSTHLTGRYPKMLWSIGYLKQFEGEYFTVATRNKTR